MYGLTPPYDSQRKKRAHDSLEEPSNNPMKLQNKLRGVQNTAGALQSNDGGFLAQNSIAAFSVQVPDSSRYAGKTTHFSPGALMRLRLVNFQVSSDCSYQFEPYLNLILGINGSGKSTIINSIFLLFRGTLAFLDRKDYGEFIQHGRQFFVVSALIQGKQQDVENPVVTMKVSMDSPKHAEWFVNNRPVTHKEVDSLISEYHIQVDNLCQYLSQFRVAKFSGESPEKRLKSTESAVGYDGMLDDHEFLSETGKQLNSLNENVTSRQKLIEGMTKKRDDLIAKEHQLQAAVSTKQQIQFMESVETVKAFEKSKAELQELETKLAEVQLELSQIEEENRENRLFIERGTQEIDRLTVEFSSADRASTQLNEQFRHGMNVYKETKRQLESILRKQAVVRASLTKRQSTLDSIENSLSDVRMEAQELRKLLNEKCMPTEKFQELQHQYNSTTEELVHAEAKFRTLKYDIDNAKRDLLVKEDILGKQERDLQLLISQNNRERSFADIPVSYRSDLEKSVHFVRERQDLFEKPIILPAILSLDIVDEKMLGIVSETSNEANLLKFVCQTRNDQQLLTKLVSETRGVRLQAAFVKPNFNASSFDQRVMGQLKNVGIEGVVSDCFDAPPAMLKYLASLGFNKILYSHRSLNEKAMDLIKKLSGNGGLRCIDSNHMYNIRTSRYGRKLRTEYNTVVQLRVTPFVRSMLKRNTQVQQERLRARMTVTSEQLSQLKDQTEAYALEHGKTTEQVSVLREQASQLKRQVREELHHRKLLDESIKEEQKLIKSKRDLEIQLKEDNEQALSLQLEQQSLVNQLEISIDSPRGQLCSLMFSISKRAISKKAPQDWRNAVRIMEQGLSSLLDRPLKLQEKYKADIRELKVRQAEDRNKSMKAEKALRDWSRWREAKSLIDAQSLEEIKLELVRLRSLVALQEQSTMTLEQVQAQLKTVIEKLTEEQRMQNGDEERLSSLQRESISIRERWESAVETLVTSTSVKFSELFGRMGKCGNVTLNRPDPLAVGTWGIDINIAFRENEALSKLSSMRHSGGERAVTTAVYLLSLQRMAKAPFRVLDEINQGMDESNERMTMEFFVEMACELESSDQMPQQYFLVTPKLISKFPNHENMNVLLITSGETVLDASKVTR